MDKVFHHPNQFLREGEDHINISGRSNLWLGQLLDPSYFKTVEYPYLGKFASVLNLWHWLRSNPSCDLFRRAHGVRQRELLKTQTLDAYVPNFPAIIGQATYDKLRDYPTALGLLNQLPDNFQLLSYYVPKNTSLRVCSNYASVVVPIAELILKALREGVEPDFSKLLSPGSDVSYAYLAPFLKRRFPQQYQELLASSS